MKKFTNIISKILLIWPYIILLLLINKIASKPIIILITILTIIINISSIYYAYSEKNNYQKLALYNMILKLVYIPIYIIIFLLAAGGTWFLTLTGIGIIYAPFVILISFIIDISMLITTSSFGLSALKITKEKSLLSPQKRFIIKIAHFLFVLDTIASIILYITIKK